MSKQWAEVTIICAAKRHGKSTLAERLTRKCSFPNALIFKEGVNLYDEAFKGYRVVDDIYKYTGGKVIVNGDNIEYRDFLALIPTNYRNGVLLIDDASAYEMDVVTPELKKILINSRKLGIEVLLMFHGMADIPIKLFGQCNNIVLGHTTDNPEYKLRKLPSGKEIMAARERIAIEAAKGNRFYREFIKLS